MTALSFISTIASLENERNVLLPSGSLASPLIFFISFKSKKLMLMVMKVESIIELLPPVRVKELL